MRVPSAEPVALPVERGIYRVRVLERFPELLSGISTRNSPSGGDWNLSSVRGTPQNPPDPAVALANREELGMRLGISLEDMVGCRQVHGSEIARVTSADGGRGMYPGKASIQGCDGMVTDTPGLYLLALSADCPPVFFYDPLRRAVGLAHSGWKGTVSRIGGRTVEAMGEHFGSRPEDITAVIGPGIGPCCYEVGQNVVDAAEAAFQDAWAEGILQRRGGSVYFDLWGAIRRALLDVGVPEANITSEGVCTAHNTDTFYSHRGEAGRCGLFGAVLGIRSA